MQAATPRTIFYARVSTGKQCLDMQLEAARKLGVPTKFIFVEKASGKRHDRPKLAEALAACRPGDAFACWRIDRVGRSLAHLSKVLADLEERGVTFVSTSDKLDTEGATGKLVLQILGAISEFERQLIVERASAGLAAARKRGVRLGAPAKWTPDMAERARSLMAKGDMNADEVARLLKVSRRTLFRGLRDARDHDALASGG